MSKVQDTQTIEEKLEGLYRLQRIDSKIDEIRTLRGELPIEVQDLEDELEGLNARVRNIENELHELQTVIQHNQQTVFNAETLINRYSKQQNNVKNNREFEALNKEVEMQRLEIELAKKKIREATRETENKQQMLSDAQRRQEIKKHDLEVKRKELAQIIEETGREENELIHQSETAMLVVEARLLGAYKRIRRNYLNGLAVVTIDRDSCGGCFNKVPPQRQLEIRQHKKILSCEHCGRILIDLYVEQEVDA